MRSAKILLLNFANRNAADNMDQSPIQIARERGHHDIVELISDWTLGANSPPKVPGPTSPESQKSPHNRHGHPTPPRSTTSPPNLIRPKMNNIAPKMSHIPRSHAHAAHTQASIQGCAPTDKCLSGDSRRAPNKRKRKSCNKAAQHQVRAKVNGYAVSGQHVNRAPPHMNEYVQLPSSMNAAPTLSPPCAEVPPNRLIKASVGRSSSNSNRGSLPELSEKDILEGLSLFDTHGCFESLPSNWESEETPLTSQAHHQSVPNLNGENPNYISATLPNSSIGLRDINMQIANHSNGARPKIARTTGNDSIPTSHYRQIMVSGADMIQPMDTMSHSQDMPMHISNDFDYGHTKLNRLLHTDGMNPLLHQQLPTPPSDHSVAYESSPGKSISPQGGGAAASFLTPSPDSPKRSPGGWSTSPQSSESSVC